MQNSPSQSNREPELPTPKEIQILYPQLQDGEKLLQAAGRVFIGKKMTEIDGKRLDKMALIQVYLNYCTEVEKNFPMYAEQAKLAFTYISNHAEHIDINDNRGHLRRLYPFLGPLITTIRIT